MKKPSLGKTLLTTSLAAALLVGGGAALLHSNAYAEDASATSSAAAKAAPADQGKWSGDHKFGAHRMEGGVLKEAAALLGVDEKTLGEELRGGKTLAQIAQEKQGWSEDTLVQKLVDAISAKLDEQVKNGKLTQAKADKAKANLSERMKKAVEGQMPFAGRGPGHRPGHGGKEGFKGGPGGFRAPAEMKDLAAFLKLSEDDLKAKLKDGQSLAAIAQAQGISEDQLIAHIKDGMTDKIKSFVEHKHPAKSDKSADPAQQQAAPAQ